MKLIDRYRVILVMAASLLVQLLAVGSYHSFEPRSIPVDYFNRYRPQAEAILQHGDLLLNGQPQTPPLYPLALAGLIKISLLLGCGANAAALLFNIVLMALTAGLVTVLVNAAFGARASLFAGLAWCTYPFGVYLGLDLGPEPMYLLSLMAVCWLLLRLPNRHVWQALPAGVACGGAILVKPIGLLLPVVAIVTLIAMARQNKLSRVWWALRSAMLLLGSLAMVLPWQVYIFQRTCVLTILSTKGSATALEGWTFGLTTGVGGDEMKLPANAEAFMRDVRDHARSDGASSVLAAVAGSAAAHPAGFIQVSLLKAARCFYGTDERWHEREIIAIQALYAILTAAGLWLWWRRRTQKRTVLLTLLVSLALMHWLMAFATFSILRYMIPGSFLMAACAGLAGDALFSRSRAAERA